MTRIKVCGLATIEQVDWAIELGYDAIGVVVTPRSKRYCPHEDALAIAKHARGRIESFAVAYTEDEVGSLRDEFDIVQLYTPAEMDNLAYSSSNPPPKGLRCKYFFYDPSVGSGVYKDIPEWVKEISQPLYIAGGLEVENVRHVIDKFRPFGIDVSSSVETSPLVKCKDKMEEFIRVARKQGERQSLTDHEHFNIIQRPGRGAI